jgi:GGDEF domain-containing protein
MGLRDAKKYIESLRKKQDNPFLWPDYLTGLPDRAAVLRKLDSIFPKIGRYALAYIRIANIHPYLLKYGSDHHAEIIQWAAAILKTNAAEIKGGFVGTVGTHDFFVISKTEDLLRLYKRSNNLFKKKMLSLYSSKDKKHGYVLRFERFTGDEVNIGFMKLVSSCLSSPPDIERINVIPYLAAICRKAEESGEDILDTGNIA